MVLRGKTMSGGSQRVFPIALPEAGPGRMMYFMGGAGRHQFYRMAYYPFCPDMDEVSSALSLGRYFLRPDCERGDRAEIYAALYGDYARRGYVTCLEMLMRMAPYTNDHLLSAMCVALRYKEVAVVKLLLLRGCPFFGMYGARRVSIFAWAHEEHWLAGVELLLEEYTKYFNEPGHVGLYKSMVFLCGRVMAY